MPERLTLEQIKEKFGEFRFYCNGNRDIYQLIDDYTALYMICAITGVYYSHEIATSVYNDKDLLKDYDKYPGIYYPDEDFEYKLNNLFILDKTYKPLEFGKVKNEQIRMTKEYEKDMERFMRKNKIKKIK